MNIISFKPIYVIGNFFAMINKGVFSVGDRPRRAGLLPFSFATLDFDSHGAPGAAKGLAGSPRILFPSRPLPGQGENECCYSPLGGPGLTVPGMPDQVGHDDSISGMTISGRG